MKYVLERILEEDYKYKSGILEFSTQKIEINIEKNAVYKGSIDINAKFCEDFKATLYSSHYRMKCLQKELNSDSNTVSYQFDAAGMEEGDVLQGEICILSNIGQFYLPFTAVVDKLFLQTSLGAMKNLFHFANLAKANWQEAVKCFYKKEFRELFTGNDIQYLNGYTGLLKPYGSEQNVEEFLIYIRKKKEVLYNLEQNEASFDASMGTQQGMIKIERNGWGYARFQIHVEGDFIELYKDSICEDDFIGNTCQVSYMIHVGELHGGYNRGRIIIQNNYIKMEYHILVNNVSTMITDSNEQWKHAKGKINVTRNYLDFSMRKISKNAWFERSESEVDKRLLQDSNYVAGRLFQAQLLILKERSNEARWVLDRVYDIIEESGCDDYEYAYYLYVNSLFEKEDKITETAIKEVRSLYQKSPSDKWIALILLNLDKQLEEPSKRYSFLQGTFDQGVNSPFIYMEAQKILSKHPEYLSRIGAYEIQLLCFIAKYSLFTKEIVDRVSHLIAREKFFSNKLYKVLCVCDKMYPNDELLSAICAYLIKCEKNSEEYFKWYELAVERELKITRLYEYYIMSIDKSSYTLLPKPILMYFSYECNMDYRITAFLYECVTRDRKSIPDLYQVYEPQIIAFLKKQIKAGRNNSNLAYLYKKVFMDCLLTDGLADEFSKILFSYQVDTDNPILRHVIIIDSRLKEEIVCPFVSGRAYVPIYSEDSCVLVEDKDGNRYITGASFKIKRLLMPEPFITVLSGNVKKNIGFYLYLQWAQKNHTTIAKEEIYTYKILIECDDIADSCKQQLLKKMLPELYEKDLISELNHALGLININDFSKKERSEYLIYLTILEYYDKAYEIVNHYGFEGLQPKMLAKICAYQINKINNEYNEDVLALSEYVFALGKYNNDVLCYLVDYAEGDNKKLREIWKRAGEAGINNKKISERILFNCLYTGAYLSEREDIFESYYDKDADQVFSKCYLAQISYDYFVKQQMIQEKLFKNIFEFYKLQSELPNVCKLAFLEHVSKSNIILSKEQEILVTKFIRFLMKEEIFFPFFLRYSELIPELALYSEDTFVEYRCDTESRVIIHYIVEGEDGNAGTYIKEEMKECYPTIFRKRFILFFGDTLQYYITEEKNGKETLTQSETIEKNSTSGIGRDSKIALLNDIAMSNALQEYDSAEEMCAEYIKKDWMGKQLFTLV